jgi:hypothetical protein
MPKVVFNLELYSMTIQLNPLQWSKLPDIDRVDPISETDRACLEDIKLVLEKYSYTSRFGIALLHSHFEVASDEIMLESCDQVNRTLTLQPVQKNQLDQANTIATVWRFDSDSVALACWNVCRTNSKGAHYQIHEGAPVDDVRSIVGIDS